MNGGAGYYGMNGGKRIFTLIELLVVIAIIAIMAALLLPALSRARASAGKVTCINSHKQLAVTMLSYVDDNDGRTMGGLLVDPYGKTWRFKLAEYQMGRESSDAADYIKAANMLVKCPAAISGGLSYPEQGGGFRYSYIAYNHYTQNARLSVMVQPSQKLMFCDVVTGMGSGYRTAGKYGSTRVYYRVATDGTSDWGVLHCRHNGSGNIAWFDGHAGSLQSPNPVDLKAVYDAAKINSSWFMPGSRITE